ncbi:hypothetical protein HY625_02235 [Candidatus Uhrbacteria bacterium]|nr:hypothetical protein [Candidatus Uhrbacteria bacterium]
MKGIIGHDHVLKHFAQLIERKALAHTYLFTGPLSVGKTSVVHHLAQSILCAKGTGDDACGSCSAHTKGVHPDFSLFDPDVYIDPETEEHPKIIKVEYVQEILRWVSMMPSISALKIQGIVHADRMNTHAANALLKILEDPPARTIFFLTAEFPERLPATLRSRAQSFRLLPVAASVLAEAFSERIALVARGCPGVAHRFSDDPDIEQYFSETIQAWIKLLREPMRIFRWLEVEDKNRDFPSFVALGHCVVHDLFRLHHARGARVLQSSVDESALGELLRRYPQERITAMSAACIRALQFLRTNASPKLIIENLFLSF